MKNKNTITESTLMTNKSVIFLSITLASAYNEGASECITIYSTAVTVALFTTRFSTTFTALIVIAYDRLDYI